ncbi:TetR/AcrR family transcriptional regulator [Leptospira wolffii]
MEVKMLSESQLLSSDPQLTENHDPLPQERNERMQKHQRKYEQSRKRIIQSALKLFSEKGFFETRIPEISAHAKVGVGSLYRHFKNKEDMFNETFRT